MAPEPAQNAADKSRSTRASVSLSPELYELLRDIAKHRKVSVAWVIRDATEKYVADQWPLLEGKKS
uniref:ribbon-helix-helix domain-containing protein n=1 Tax=Yoonia sp. TaxID=2212373 RepID=UPI004047281B